MKEINARTRIIGMERTRYENKEYILAHLEPVLLSKEEASDLILGDELELSIKIAGEEQ